MMITTSLAFVLGIAIVAEAPSAPREQAAPLAAEQYFILPLRIHILISRDLELADCATRT